MNTRTILLFNERQTARNQSSAWFCLCRYLPDTHIGRLLYMSMIRLRMKVTLTDDLFGIIMLIVSRIWRGVSRANRTNFTLLAKKIRNPFPPLHEKEMAANFSLSLQILQYIHKLRPPLMAVWFNLISETLVKKVIRDSMFHIRSCFVSLIKGYSPRHSNVSSKYPVTYIFLKLKTGCLVVQTPKCFTLQAFSVTLYS